MNPLESCSLTVKVTPKASCNKIVLTKDLIRVYVTDPPQDQAANQATCKLLSKSLQVAFSKIWVISGHHCRDKKIQVGGLSLQEVEKRLRSKWGYQESLEQN